MIEFGSLERQMVPPRGDNRVEISLWNALRAFTEGAAEQEGNATVLREADVILSSPSWPLYLANMSQDFRDGLRNVLDIILDGEGIVREAAREMAQDFARRLRRALSAGV